MDTIFTDGQLTKFIKTMRQKNMTPDRFNDLLGSGILADVLDPKACLSDRDAVRRALKLDVALPESITLSVNYGRSLEKMIAAGNYDWENEDITAKKFPVQGSGIEQFEAKVSRFDLSMSSKAAVKAIKSAGWEPGKIEHLLSFGEKYPEEQWKYLIIALGSVAEVGGSPNVPCLDRSGAGRFLDLFWCGSDWRGRYRFLAVRPVKIPGSSATQV